LDPLNRPTTEAIYDAEAARWARSEKVLLSDFTARPLVVDALMPLSGRHVLDLGCGEGYVSRLVMQAGAASVFGVDISAEMVERARQATPDSSPMQFATGNLSQPMALSRQHYDRIMAVFLFNYITIAEMTDVLRLARKLLVPGGRFVFTIPHPCFPYMRASAPPFFFDHEGQSYFGGADQTYEGRIWRRDDTSVPVRCVHKPLEAYFRALREAGWTQLPEVQELRVLPEHLALDPTFFGPLEGQPLHMLFALKGEP
jgi:SAM-dependent methyltransferase